MTTRSLRARHLIKEMDERCGGRELDLLSVSMTRGVIPRTEVTDKEARADDLSNYKVCRQGDIVVNRMSAYQGALGMSNQTGIVSPDYIVFRPFPGVEPRWLHHVMRSTWFVSEMSARIRGIGSIGTGNVRTPRVSSEEIRDIRVSVPEAQEQRAIADFLDSETARIDALITKKQRMIDLIGLRRLTLISNGVWGLLESSDLSGVGTWRPRPLKHVLSANDGGIWGDDPTPDSATAVVRSTEITMSGEWRLDDVEYRAIDAASRKSKSLKVGDLVVVKSSGSVAHLGKTAIVTSEVEALGACFANFVQRLRLGPEAIPRFTWYLLNSSRAATEMEIAGNTTTGLRNLNAEVIGSVTFPGAPVGIQQKIVSELDHRVGQISLLLSTLERQLERLREHRQALITAAVTGQIEISGVAA